MGCRRCALGEISNHANTALGHLSNALDDLQYSPDQRPVPLINEAVAHLQEILRADAQGAQPLQSPAAKGEHLVYDEAFVVRMLDFQPLAGRNLGDRLWQILEAGGIRDGEQIPALLGALRHAMGDQP